MLLRSSQHTHNHSPTFCGPCRNRRSGNSKCPPLGRHSHEGSAASRWERGSQLAAHCTAADHCSTACWYSSGLARHTPPSAAQFVAFGMPVTCNCGDGKCQGHTIILWLYRLHLLHLPTIFHVDSKCFIPFRAGYTAAICFRHVMNPNSKHGKHRILVTNAAFAPVDLSKNKTHGTILD